MACNPKPERQWYRRVYGAPPSGHKRRHRQELRWLVNEARLRPAAPPANKKPEATDAG